MLSRSTLAKLFFVEQSTTFNAATIRAAFQAKYFYKIYDTDDGDKITGIVKIDHTNANTQ